MSNEPQPEPDPITHRLADLYRDAHNNRDEITMLHLRAIALAVRETHPDAAAFHMWWSDQGNDEWLFGEVYDAHGEPITTGGIEELQDRLDGYRLDGSQRSLWAPLTSEPQAFGNYQRSPDLALFTVEDVLTHTAAFAPKPTPAPRSEAEKAFRALPADRRELLLTRVFETLEFDNDGNPGSQWSSDTTQALGDLFNTFGVTFTSPDEFEDDDDE